MHDSDIDSDWTDVSFEPYSESGLLTETYFDKLGIPLSGDSIWLNADGSVTPIRYNPDGTTTKVGVLWYNKTKSM